MTSSGSTNMFLRGSLGTLFARTAAPIILIMVINGLYVVVDAWLLGVYVGPAALSAVTLIFPMMMMLFALQTLVSNGMASILARELGAGRRQQASATFTGAHLLACGVVLLLWSIYWLFGEKVIGIASAGAPEVADNAHIFMAVTVAFAPIGFILSLNIDALRCEGRLGFMTIVTISATLLNILFNWLLMGVFGWGVAGSAIGTVMAQFFCLSFVLAYRWRTRGALRLSRPGPVAEWRSILALGAPTSLGMLGISLSSAAVIFNLRLWQTDSFVATIAAYGIITRILTFAYLPLMGVSIAFQTICGNNFGAGERERTNKSLRIALTIAFLYCAAVEAVILLFGGGLGAAFVDDPKIIAETTRILPWTVAAYAIFGLPVILSGYFQSIGDAGRAGIFGLSRIYLFTIPLVFVLPHIFGEMGVWMATPAAELCMLALVTIVLIVSARKTGWRFGLLQPV
ncbi:MATE family efflux transporter [Rhizobium sp. KVB221]|uniref:Multidrug export protein MepA n=1 Tax=Rhizobium setariae TaxID=2801340 RepID=A0A937CNV9_9HYPH|nr:MATE family efflux transporter [Rhizobium setariae]MBL0371122.1 MATE family efflux transporter [Rhizobium setariae]